MFKSGIATIYFTRQAYGRVHYFPVALYDGEDGTIDLGPCGGYASETEAEQEIAHTRGLRLTNHLVFNAERAKRASDASS